MLKKVVGALLLQIPYPINSWPLSGLSFLMWLVGSCVDRGELAKYKIDCIHTSQDISLPELEMLQKVSNDPLKARTEQVGTSASVCEEVVAQQYEQQTGKGEKTSGGCQLAQNLFYASGMNIDATHPISLLGL